MENDLAVDMLAPDPTENFHITTIIMDDDWTKMAKLRKSVPHDVSKERDKSC